MTTTSLLRTIAQCALYTWLDWRMTAYDKRKQGKSDSRSSEATEYRKLYSTARWRRLRDMKLAQDPLCQWCLEHEVVEPATEVHHADGGHKGDVEKFWSGPFVSTCKPCHASIGQREDRGTLVTYGVDGYPIG